jgi:predicted transcriptional regulator
MAANRVQIELDEELVLRARARASTTDVSDHEVIADAVAEWLAFATLQASPVPGLAPAEADKLAVAEVRAHRASHDSAA